MIRKEQSSLVSVIMSEYSTPEAYLAQSIESVLHQTYNDFEFIIVDDSHSQRLDEYIKRYKDSRIRVVKNGSNKGLVASLNKAIEHAEGDYIIRMDTDDIAHPERFERQITFIANHPEYAVVGSRVNEFSGNKKIGILGNPGEKTRRDIMRGEAPVHPSVIMKKSAVIGVGGYPNYQRAEDFALWCELLLANKRFCIMDDVLLDYRVNPEDYSKRTIRNRGGELRARSHYYPLLGARPPEYVRILKSVLAGLAPTWLIRWYRAKTAAKVSK